MAITKIHPIKSTLKIALDYIMNSDKTDEIENMEIPRNPKARNSEYIRRKLGIK